MNGIFIATNKVSDDKTTIYCLNLFSHNIYNSGKHTMFQGFDFNCPAK
jgi:hypothetical protein